MSNINLNEYLRANSIAALNDSNPAAPDGATNVQWQADDFGNISGSTVTPGSAAGTAGQVQATDGNGAFVATSITDNGTAVTISKTVEAGSGGNLRIVDEGSGVSAVVFDGATNSIKISNASGEDLVLDAGSGGEIDFRSGGNFVASIASGIVTLPALKLTSTAIETSATAGTASALPATPAGYLDLILDGSGASFIKIPFYLP